MSVLIIGTGRSGTNVILEILSGSSELVSPGKGVIQKFSNTRKIKHNHVMKVDIVGFDHTAVEDFVEMNKGVKLVWSIRDPRDICMSKIKRGVPISRGGDCVGFSPDGTPRGSVEYIKLMVDIYEKFKDCDYSILVRMEDVLLETERETKRLCEFIGIPYEESMTKFYERMRNQHKKNRYNGKDLSQIGMWRNWEESYYGYFVRNNIDMEKVFEDVMPFVHYFGYEE